MTCITGWDCVSAIVFAVVTAVVRPGQASRPAGTAATVHQPLTLEQMSGSTAVIETTAVVGSCSTLPDRLRTRRVFSSWPGGAYNGTSSTADQARHHPGRRVRSRKSRRKPLNTGPAVSRCSRSNGGGQSRARAVCRCSCQGTGQRRRAVLHLRDRAALARRAVHRVRPRGGGHRRRDLISEAPLTRPQASRADQMTSVTIRTRHRPASFLLAGIPRTWPSTSGARNELGSITIRVPARQGSQPRAELPAAASAGRLRSDGVSPVLPGFMIQTGYLGSKQMVMDEAQRHCRHAPAGVQRHPHDKGSCRWPGGGSRQRHPSYRQRSRAVLDLTVPAFGRWWTDERRGGHEQCRGRGGAETRGELVE